MRYYSRKEVERIGRAGAYYEDLGDMYKCRVLSSYWLCVEKDDNAFTPWMTVKKDNFWESWITKWISEQLEDTDLFIDVGANVGYYSMLAATSGTRTVAIEPNPDLMKYLKKSRELNKVDVDILNYAVGSTTIAQAPLYIPFKHSGAAYIGKEFSCPGRVVDVSIETLDNLLSGQFQQNILIKVDTEGAEPYVWKGSERLRKNNSVTYVLEWHRDRKGAQAFYEALSTTGPVYVVDYEGSLQEVTLDELNSSDDIRMIVSK